MRVALLGFGLIGGSIARSLRRDAGRMDRSRRGARRVTGRRGHATRVSSTRRIDVAGARQSRDADLIVLAGPPLATLELIDELGRGRAGRSDPPGRHGDGRREHQGGDRRPRRRLPACGSSAATRWPAVRRPATSAATRGPLRRPAVGRRPRARTPARRRRAGGAPRPGRAAPPDADGGGGARRRRRRRSATCRSSSRRRSSRRSPGGRSPDRADWPVAPGSPRAAGGT